ncbi:hypothetical protein HYT53_04065 [Candidatus Woesearchaeota archaeon]|nr:hypothetical protein [Candidatus Woesearchaeota archaeon]
MTLQQSPKELVEELNRHRIEASKLRNALNELDKEKESWFKKKEEFSKKIRDSIQAIKYSKAKRDFLTKEVRELKPKRDAINKDINGELKEFDRLKKEKLGIAKSLDIKEPPSRIKQNIEKLEFRIETETSSFEKEKELMKKIKQLKKLYEDSKAIDDADKNLKNSSDEIKRMKKEANDIHKLVQEKAHQSQILHEGILKLSAEIDKMKIEEEAVFRKFSELKSKFSDVNSQLKEKLKAMNDVKASLDRISSDRREKKRQEVESFLKSKEDAVNEKIKRKEKLTTEDLLVFQKFGKD